MQYACAEKQLGNQKFHCLSNMTEKKSSSYPALLVQKSMLVKLHKELFYHSLCLCTYAIVLSM